MSKKQGFTLLKRTVILITFLSMLSFLGFSQQSTLELPAYHPASPNAASLGNFGLYPVNKNLGTANISVPIYILQEKGLTIPINLNYNSSGVRLNDLASWVGLGWSLNCGGAIIRNTKGLPDLTHDAAIPDLENATFNQTNWGYMYNTSIGKEDTAPDQYVFNALGISGSFYFDPNNGYEAIFEDSTPIKIEVLTTEKIKAILEDGTTLIFGTGNDASNATEYTNSNLDDPFYTLKFVSAWYLAEVTSPDGQNTISFKYKEHEVSGNTMHFDYSTPATESVVLGPGVPANATSHLTVGNNELTQTERKYLDEIVFSTGRIKFESALNRDDLLDDYKLDAIKVYNKINNVEKLIEEHHFVYDYFLRSGGNFSNNYETSFGPLTFTSDRQTRSRSKSLKLTEVYKGASSSEGQRHQFIYNGTALPLRCTTAQDSWGYCNNNTGTLLSESLEVIYDLLNTIHFTVGNGNRDSNETKMKAGVLEKVIYPTGGYTEFEHEANRLTVTEPVLSYNSYTARAYGLDCVNDVHVDTETFTIPSTATNIRLYIDFSPVTSQGAESYVSISNSSYLKKYYRPTPNSSGGAQDSSDGGTETINLYFGDNVFGDILNYKPFLAGDYEIKAVDNGYGGLPALGCSSLTVRVSWDEPNGTQQVENLVGGLRIKSISNYDGISMTPTTVKNFEYENPNLIHPQRNRAHSRLFMSISGGILLKNRISSSPHFNNNLGGEPVIEYGKVTEYDCDQTTQQNNGKLISYYENVPSVRILNSVIPAILFLHPQFDWNFEYIDYNSGNYHPFNELADFYVNQLVDKALYGIQELSFYETTSWKRGKLTLEETYKSEGNDYVKIKSIDNNYVTSQSVTLKNNYIYSPWESTETHWNIVESPYDQFQDFMSLQFGYQVGETAIGRKVLNQTIETLYDTNGQNPVVTSTDYYYDNPTHLQLTRTVTTDSEGQILISKTNYPDDVSSASSLIGGILTTEEYAALENLKSDGLNRRIAQPIQTEFYNDYDLDGVTDTNELLSTQRTTFRDWDGNGTISPEGVYTLKGIPSPSNQLQERITYHHYDNKGNPSELSKTDDVHTVYIWGYNQTLPIAQIENATYAQVEAALGTTELALLMGNTLTEQQYRDKIALLRNHPSMNNAMVTGFTYDPLIGLTSQTDPNGITVYYEYDSAGRLEHIKDFEGNILSKTEYHYKNTSN